MAEATQARQQLAAAITARRAELGLSQAALARRAAVSPRTIWNLENTSRQPRPGCLHAILTALGMTTRDTAPPVHGTDNGYKRGKCARGLGWPLLPGPAEVTSRG